MQIHEAVQSAPNYIRNASEIAARTPVNADTLYMWDNQVTAIELFLAETEDYNAQNPDLARMRKELWGLKKQIEAKVLEFELKQENQEVPPEPTEEEVLADLTEYSRDVLELVKELNKVTPKTLKDLQELEDPRQQLINFLVESEPLQGKSKSVDTVRLGAKKCKADLDAKCNAALKAIRQQEANEPDDDE